jgi:Secretion system C-terminal sorting domain
MTKNYFYTALFFLFFSMSALAQEEKQSAVNSISQEQEFDALTVYPNPVSTGHVYVSSRTNAQKDIEIFDVLGKRVLQTTIAGKELNVSALSPGVYIIKIREAEQRATRKLIVR